MPVITKRFVDAIKPVERLTIYWDDDMPGFGVRVMPSGFIGFLVQYRAGKGRGAPTRKVSLGAYGKITVDQAREAAKLELGKAILGGDPVAERKAVQAEALRSNERTFGKVLDRFAKQHLTTLRTGAEVERALRRHALLRWQNKRIDRVSKGDAISLLDDVTDSNSPFAARLLRAYLHKLFTWAEGKDLVAANPVRGTAKPAIVIERDRVLTDSELVAFWASADALPYPWGPYLKVLALTAQRRDEVASMRWQDVDLNAGLWRIPRESTKADRAHEVPLSEPVKLLLEGIERLGEHVFTNSGLVPIQGHSKLKTRLDTAMLAALRQSSPKAVLPAWRVHDLRRTAATYMGRGGVQRDSITLVLNHALGGVTSIYDRAGRLPEKRHALDTWARVLVGIVSGEKDQTNIVPLKRA
jgi:integrase